MASLTCICRPASVIWVFYWRMSSMASLVVHCLNKAPSVLHLQHGKIDDSLVGALPNAYSSVTRCSHWSCSTCTVSVNGYCFTVISRKSLDEKVYHHREILSLIVTLCEWAFSSHLKPLSPGFPSFILTCFVHFEFLTPHTLFICLLKFHHTEANTRNVAAISSCFRALCSHFAKALSNFLNSKP